jgi:curved DNA binding protein
VELCEAGDKYIEDECAKIYKDKKVTKGIGFPTCISPNTMVGHFSPMADEKMEIKAGDMLKIDLGCNVDGYVGVVATTVMVAPEGFAKNITGRQADVLMATHTAAEIASRLTKAGAKGTEVAAAINKVAEAFNCTAVLGVCSHNVTRNCLDGEKTIVPKYDEGQKPDECEIVVNEVYVVDVVMSTGDGKPKEVAERTTVYMRAPNTTYALKMKASRFVLSQVQEKHPHFPFSLRSFVSGDEGAKCKMGIKECVEHGILNAYPVLEEKRDQFVGHVKFTVLVMPSGPLKTTGVPMDVEQIKSDLKVKDDELLKLLATSGKKKKKKPKKKAPAAGAKPGAAAGAGTAAGEAEAEESGED